MGAPGGIANTGIVALVQLADAPPPPPATAAAYTKKSNESGGVIAMMDLLVKDLDKELQTAEVEEKNAKEEYSQLVADSAEKRRQDSKSLTDKESAKGDLEEMLEKYADEKKDFDVRKQARSDEIDSLGKAKAVLSGADFS